MSMETKLPLGTRLTDLHNFAAEDAANLLLAAEKGDLVRIETLAIQKRVPINVRDKNDGTQAIHLACAHGGGRKILEFLINTFQQQHPDQPLSSILDAKDNEGFTPLMTCASSTNDRIEETSYLLHRGANVFARNNYGGTCLHIAAAQNSSAETAKRILNHCHFDPKLVNGVRRDGFTPLILAIFYKNVNVARFLITEANADCTLKTNVGETALHIACARKGMMPVIRLLIEHGRASPNTRDDAGSTPLHAAVNENLLEVVEYLCQHGAVLYFDNHRKSPYDFAKQNNNSEIADFLKDYAVKRKAEMLQQQQQQQQQNNNTTQNQNHPAPLSTAASSTSSATPLISTTIPSPEHNNNNNSRSRKGSVANNNNNNHSSHPFTTSLVVPTNNSIHSNNPSRPATPKEVSPLTPNVEFPSSSSSSTCPNCSNAVKRNEDLMSKFEQERKQWKAQVEYLKKKLEKSENDSKREIERLNEVVEGANNARKFETRMLQEEIAKLRRK